MILCDTNIVSELAKPSPNRGALSWASTVARVAVSVITVEEISFGLTRRPNARISAWFAAFFEHDCDVLPVTREVADRCGRLRGALASSGRTLTQADGLIAATAQLRAATLVTRNVSDFDQCQVAILNPFT